MTVIRHGKGNNSEDCASAQGSTEKRAQSRAHGLFLILHVPYPSVRSATIHPRFTLVPIPQPRPRPERVPQNERERV